MPDKAKKQKKVDRLRVGEKKDVGAREDVLVCAQSTLLRTILKGG